MNRNMIRRVIEILFTSKKSIFELVCESRNGKYKYTYRIDGGNYKISETVSEEKSNFGYNQVYNDVDKINVPKDLVIKSITDERYTFNGKIASRETIYVYREPELFIKLFRVLQENAVFYLANEQKNVKAYYINSRVFYVKELEDSITLYDTDLFKLYSSLPGGRVIMISKLPKKVNCGEFINSTKSESVTKGKKFNIVKNRVVI